MNAAERLDAAEGKHDGERQHDGAAEAPGLLDTGGAARLLGISPRTVQTWVRQKRIPFVKLGSLTRFRPAALQQWIEAQEVGADQEARTAQVRGE